MSSCRNYDALERTGLMLPTMKMGYPHVKEFKTILKAMYSEEVREAWNSTSPLNRVKLLKGANPTLEMTLPPHHSPTMVSTLLPEAFYTPLSKDGALDDLITTSLVVDSPYITAVRKFGSVRLIGDVPGFHTKRNCYYNYLTDKYYIVKDDKVKSEEAFRLSMMPDHVAAKALFRLQFLYQFICTTIADFRDMMKLPVADGAETKCFVCKGPMKKKSCSRCLSVFYCSTICQKQDWKAGHKNLCFPMAKMGPLLARLPDQVHMKKGTEKEVASICLGGKQQDPPSLSSVGTVFFSKSTNFLEFDDLDEVDQDLWRKASAACTGELDAFPEEARNKLLGH
jgi:hypothetical protein